MAPFLRKSVSFSQCGTVAWVTEVPREQGVAGMIAQLPHVDLVMQAS
jgi:hypothetical protein